MAYARARADWIDWPLKTTPVRQQDLDQWDQAIYDLKNQLFFNVMDFGTGVGAADATIDTPAFQAAATAAIAVGGTMLIPPPSVAYRLNDTITLQPASGTTFYLNIVGAMQDSAIIPTWSTANKAVFKSLGWNRGYVSGVQIKTSTIAGTTNRVIAWDIDANGTYTSSKHVHFDSCRVNIDGTGTDHVGWRLGHSSVGKDISYMTWTNCKVHGKTNFGTQGELGWVMEGQNTLQHSWFGCGGDNLLRRLTNVVTTGAADTLGGGGFYLHGCGGELNDTEFEVSRKYGLAVHGGRFERGKTILSIPNSADLTFGGDTTFSGTRFSGYQGSGGVLFNINGSGSYVFDNVDVYAEALGAYGAGMITVGGAGTIGSLIVNGGKYEAADPFYTVSSGDWAAGTSIKKALIVNATQDVTGRITDV